ncbi:MAG: histidinol-phosphate transaminase [Dehalococcoidales bacterium]|nr:histidinol-phosphate transaminase [Dehalococcoidales bacterium]
MPEGIEKYVRKELLTFGAYSSPKASDKQAEQAGIPLKKIIKIDQNENLFGPSPRVNRILAKNNSFNIYPDAEQTAFRKQLSEYTGVGPECIVGASGSNQLLDLITRLFVGEGDRVVNCVPTFDIYRFSTQVCGGKLVEIQRDENFAIDVKAMRRAVDKKTKLIFLANPNAPTGNLTPRKDLIEVLEIGIPTCIDEAYYEFSGVTVVPLMKRYPNLMVVRTFSKWAGLAGLRVGYGLFPPAVADLLHRIKIPYNINVAALTAVQESMLDLDYLMNRVKVIVAERDKLYAGLKKMPWLTPYPSKANFILCKLLKGNAAELQDKLQEKGILVRYFAKPRLENCIRLSIGKPEHTDIVLQTLREIGSSW